MTNLVALGDLLKMTGRFPPSCVGGNTERVLEMR